MSTNSEMEIETDELSGGKLNKETGIIEWKLKLTGPTDKKEVLLYSKNTKR